MSFIFDPMAMTCAKCGLVDRGDPHERMLTISHPERGVVWMGHKDCTWRTVREVRRQMLPMLRLVRRLDDSRWLELETGITSGVLHDPGRFVKALQNIYLEFGLSHDRMIALGTSPETYLAWVGVVEAALRRFNTLPRPAAPDPIGPQLRLVPPPRPVAVVNG